MVSDFTRFTFALRKVGWQFESETLQWNNQWHLAYG